MKLLKKIWMYNTVYRVINILRIAETHMLTSYGQEDEQFTSTPGVDDY